MEDTTITNPPQAPATQPEPVTNQNQPVNQTDVNAAPDSTPQAPDYIEAVGGDMIGLLDEINADDNLVQEVADEMQLDKDNVKSVLATLLNKIDQGQITAEELALIIASTVVDETNEEMITDDAA